MTTVKTITFDPETYPKTEDVSCWMDPQGKVAFVDDHGGSHCRAAEALGDKSGGQDLERAGWLHISWSSVYTGFRDGRDIEPTQAQLNTLFDLAQHVEKSYPGSYVADRFNRFIAKHNEEQS